MNKYDINNPRPLPSQEELRKRLDYDPETGVLKWREHKNRTDLIGKPCGAKRKGGYLSASIGGHKFSVHRIIYKWMTGEEAVIMDHINGKPDDNRWCNLRSVTHQENNMNVGLLKNNKTGTTGVTYRADHDRYVAIVRINRKNHHLGSFKTEEEAIAARKAANVLLGFSDRHGSAA